MDNTYSEKRGVYEGLLAKLNLKRDELLKKQDILEHGISPYSAQEIDSFLDQGVANVFQLRNIPSSVEVEGKIYTSSYSIAQEVDRFSRAIQTVIGRIEDCKRKENPTLYMLQEKKELFEKLNNALFSSQQLFSESIVYEGKDYSFDEFLKMKEDCQKTIRFLEDHQSRYYT